MRLNLTALLFSLVLPIIATAGRIEKVETDPRLRDQNVASIQLQVVSTPSRWLKKTQHLDVVYLAYAVPSRVERYSLSSNQWLAPIPLSGVAQAIAVSDAGIFVSQNNRVSQFDLSGGNERNVPNAWINPTDIGIAGQYLISAKNRELQSLRISDYSQVAVYTSFGGYDTPAKISISDDAKVIYGWQVGLSPSDILRIPVFPNGTFGAVLSSPYHGSFPASSRVFADRDGQFVVDQAGIAFNSNSLTYRSGTGGPINDTTQADGMRYVLRSNSIARLTSDFRELGVRTLSAEFHAVAVYGTDVYLFQDFGSGPQVQSVASEKITGYEASLPPDPMKVPFTTDFAELASDGVLYLLNRSQKVVHRLTVRRQYFLPSVALPESPLFASVDRSTGDTFLSYEGGRMTIVPSFAPAEQFLAYSPISACGLGAADNFVMICDDTGAWSSHRIFDKSGTERDWREWNYYSREYSWNSATRRMYFFRDGTSPNDLHFEQISDTGIITSAGETPLHGDVLTTLPIRPNPNGSAIFLGSGQIYDGVNLSLLGQFPLPPKDITWVGTVAYTLHSDSNGNTRFIRWNQNNTIMSEITIAGSPIRVFSNGSKLITLVHQNGRTSIQVWNTDFSNAGFVL